LWEVRRNGEKPLSYSLLAVTILVAHCGIEVQPAQAQGPQLWQIHHAFPSRTDAGMSELTAAPGHVHNRWSSVFRARSTNGVKHGHQSGGAVQVWALLTVTLAQFAFSENRTNPVLPRGVGRSRRLGKMETNGFLPSSTRTDLPRIKSKVQKSIWTSLVSSTTCTGICGPRNHWTVGGRGSSVEGVVDGL